MKLIPLIIFGFILLSGCTDPNNAPCIKEETPDEFCTRAGQEIKQRWFIDELMGDQTPYNTPSGKGFPEGETCCLKIQSYSGGPTGDFCGWESDYNKRCTKRATPDVLEEMFKGLFPQQ